MTEFDLNVIEAEAQRGYVRDVDTLRLVAEVRRLRADLARQNAEAAPVSIAKEVPAP